MLRRKVSSGFVCLQCRAQLGRVVGRRPFATAHDENQAIIDAIRGIERPAEIPKPPPQSRRSAGNAFAGTEDIRQSIIEAISETEQAPEKTDPSPRDEIRGADADDSQPISKAPIRKPFGNQEVGEDTHGLDSLVSQKKTYRSRGKRVRPKHESLPIGILGQPGAALVFQDRGRIRKGKLEEMAPEEAPQSELTVLEALENESPSLTDDYIFRNIHELQPKGPKPPTASELEVLRQALVGGFTSAQLASYIATFRPGQPKSRDPVWVEGRRPWTPTSSVTDPTEAVSGGHSQNRLAPKERLALQLMRQCWGLSMGNEGRMGCLEVTFRDLEMALLLRMLRSSSPF